MIEITTLDACLKLTYQYPGLIVGPSATSHVAAVAELRQQLIALVAPGKVPEGFSGQYDTIDYLRQHFSDKSTDADNLVRLFYKSLAPSTQVPYLADGRWSVIISLASDMHLEDKIHERLDRTPSSRTATVVTDPSVVPPANTLPIIKLLGSNRDNRRDHALAIGGADALRRRLRWRKMLGGVGDYLRDAPLFIAGTETIVPLVRDCITELYGSGPPYPSSVVILKGDPLLNDPTMIGLLSSYSKVFQVDATLRQVCESAATAQPLRLGIAIKAADTPVRNQSLVTAIEPYRTLIDVVPAGLPDSFDEKAVHLQLIDGLFRPTSLDWLPYLCNYDMRRTDVSAIVEAIERKKEFIDRQANPWIVVKGEAGIGKTAIAKRVAIDMAAKGDLVLWCKRSPVHSPGAMRKLAIEVREALNKVRVKNRPIIVICDDPWGARITPTELISSFQGAGLEAICLFFVRFTELLPEQREHAWLPGVADEDIQVNYQLLPNDIVELKKLLVRVDVATSEADASARIEAMPTRNADDVLCSLWYLIPQTHSELSGSIQDEYARLGLTGVIKEYASKANSSGDRIRLAYELVAVTSKLDIGLPLELLRRVTEASYEEWIETNKAGGPLWGLLYDDFDAENGTLVYFTRNEIVTRVLLEIVNGGLGHAGEFQRLKQLVAACSVGTTPYRNFLYDLLGRSRQRLQEILTYEQGRELYETALEVFPEADRHLRYRYGLWKHHAGKDHIGAYAEYQTALDTPNYMYSAKSEPDEHIHTSSAAAVVARVKEGSQDVQTGLNQVQQHLRQASHPRFFDPHMWHVFANLFFQIARKSREARDAPVTLESYSEALRTIERTMQIIGADGRKQIQFAKDIQMFQELHEQILGSIGDLEETKKYAQACFESSKLQTGFEVVGRKMLATAMRTNNGSDYNSASSYIESAVAVVTSSDNEVSVDLRALQVDVILRWRVQQTRGKIDWSSLCTWLDILVGNSKYRDDYLKLYYYGVSLYHNGDFSKANAIFENMRNKVRPSDRVRKSIRNYLVGEEGFARRLQGTLREAHGRLYIFSPDLGADVYVGRANVGAQPSATVHFYVAFTMEGPRAVFDPPEKMDLLMP